MSGEENSLIDPQKWEEVCSPTSEGTQEYVKKLKKERDPVGREEEDFLAYQKARGKI